MIRDEGYDDGSYVERAENKEGVGVFVFVDILFSSNDARPPK